jgi:hypothetical protein
MKNVLNRDILTAAIAGYRLEQQRLEDKIANVQAMLDGNTPAKPVATPEAPTGKRKKRSAAVRRRMAQAQKARWAKLKGESEPVVEAPKAKRKLSASGRKAIVAATKKRWAAKQVAAESRPAIAKRKAVKKTAPKKAAKATKKTAAKTTPAPAVTSAGAGQ